MLIGVFVIGSTVAATLLLLLRLLLCFLCLFSPVPVVVVCVILLCFLDVLLSLLRGMSQCYGPAPVPLPDPAAIAADIA